MKKSLASILTVCLLTAFVLSGCSKTNEQSSSFVPPQNYVTVIQVAINPTVNLYLDVQEVILAVEYVNADAKECYEKVESQLIGSNLENALDVVIEAAAADGYFSENKKITIDIVEAIQEDKKLSAIQTANDTAKSVIYEKQIEAEVTLTEKAQKVVDDKIAADKAEEDRLANEKEAAEKELRNPKKNLKFNIKYSIIKPGESDELLSGIHIKFKDNGEYTYSMVPYLNDPYGEGEYIIYNGMKYFVAGGGGGAGTYSLTDEKIILSGAFEMELTMTTDGKLVIRTMNANDDFFIVNDVLSVEQ